MYSIFKNNFVLGLLSALVVIFLIVMDYRRKGESVNTGNVAKIGSGVFGTVTAVSYLSNYLHGYNKQLGGASDMEVDTGLPQF